jgi:hypothetical protein
MIAKQSNAMTAEKRAAGRVVLLVFWLPWLLEVAWEFIKNLQYS